MAYEKNAAIEWFWWLHPRIYRLTGGRIGGTVMGMPVLLLTTRGRRTGLPRTRALTYLPRGDTAIVVASYLGEPRHPAWWLNLEANPDAEIQIGSTIRAVRAREASGEERNALWSEIVTSMEEYAAYETRTDRRIPVVVLEPRPS